MNWRSEYKKCLMDTSRQYMIEKHVFNKPLWETQSDLLKFINDKDCTIVTKSRNVGFTDLLAAYVACELVLNSDGLNDDDFNIYYYSSNYQLAQNFVYKVREYVRNTPKMLFSCGFFDTNDFMKLNINKAFLTVGSLSDLQNIGICKSCNLFICDELITGSSKNVNDYNIETMLFLMREKLKDCKIIIGGTPNHKNKTWFNIVKNSKENNNYFVLPWWSNPKHIQDENDSKIPIIKQDGEIEYFNKWYLKMRRNYCDTDAFDEEIGCKVWQEKIVKEYI